MIQNRQIKNVIMTSSVLALTGIFVVALSTSGVVAAQTTPAPGSTLEQRIDQRKKERNVSLDPKDQARLINSCVGAQAKVRTLQQQTVQATDKRTKLYRQIDARLWIMVGKLKLAQKDTFEFEKQRTEFAQRAAAFEAVAQNYKQTLDDLALVNCKADPVGFKALLDTARLYQTEIRKSSVNLHDYVVNTIKPSLSAFAADLAGQTRVQGEGSYGQ